MGEGSKTTDAIKIKFPIEKYIPETCIWKSEVYHANSSTVKMVRAYNFQDAGKWLRVAMSDTLDPVCDKYPAGPVIKDGCKWQLDCDNTYGALPMAGSYQFYATGEAAPDIYILDTGIKPTYNINVERHCPKC